MRYRLNGRTVILSGAGSGIGRAMTTELITRYSCRVIGIGRHASRLEETAELLGDKKNMFSYSLFDVADPAGWSALADRLSAEGITPDILINNAGMLPKFDRMVNVSPEDMHRVMEVNFFSGVYSVKSLLPLLLGSDSPAIVNIASSAALAPIAGTAFYSASKGAVKNATESLREELSGKVYVALVCPGFSRTNIFREQHDMPPEKLLDLIATPCEKIARRIVRGITRRRQFMTIGADAVLMDFFSKHFRVLSYRTYRRFMEASGLKMFSDIFGSE